MDLVVLPAEGEACMEFKKQDQCARGRDCAVSAASLGEEAALKLACEELRRWKIADE